MKNLMIFTVLFIFCMNCDLDDYGLDNQDIERLVLQIKNGTYNE